MKSTMLFLALILMLCSTAFPQAGPWVQTDTLTRGLVVSAYSSGQAVGSRILVFDKASRTAPIGGLLMGADIKCDTPNVANAQFDLLVFADSVNIPTPVDMQTYTLTYAQTIGSSFTGKLVAIIPLTLLSTYGTGAGVLAFGQTTLAPPPPYYVDTKTKLYGVLIAKAAYVGARLGKIAVTLRFVR